MAARRSLVSGRRHVGPASRALPKSFTAIFLDRVMAMLEIVTMMTVEIVAVLMDNAYLTV